MKKPRQSFGLVAIGRKLYAFGGMGESRMEASAEVYDPEVDRWSAAADMPEARYEMSVVSYNDAVYVLGGYTRLQRCASDLLRYDPMQNQWCRLRPLRRFDFRLMKLGRLGSQKLASIGIRTVETAMLFSDIDSGPCRNGRRYLEALTTTVSGRRPCLHDILLK
ncbi:Kelch-like protein 4 [Eumeta japonica]|uniref:Kelch-like protein 4 n=1 Tax=Eumeta variegata TaxID=151549 RepID=A0A4C1YBE1_EUMVA|nr:Kelch-like protein 4 [Eumeta japonica]